MLMRWLVPGVLRFRVGAGHQKDKGTFRGLELSTPPSASGERKRLEQMF